MKTLLILYTLTKSTMVPGIQMQVLNTSVKKCNFIALAWEQNNNKLGFGVIDAVCIPYPEQMI